MKLMRCWAHQLDLVSDVWQDSFLNNKVHSLTTKFQHIMNRSSVRKARYIEFLKRDGVQNPKCMPTVVITRWNTWYKAIQYLAEYLPRIRNFIKEEKETQDNSELINSLAEILENYRDFAEIQLMVRFNFERAEVFHNIIEEFEQSMGITHLAYNKIRNLWNHLRLNIYMNDFGESIDEIITNNHMDRIYWMSEFKNLYKLAWKKLNNLMVEHESIDFLKAVRIFDPEQLPILSKNIEDYSDLKFQNEDLIKEFKNYIKFNIVADYEKGLIPFWRSLESVFPNLSKLAIKCLNTPVNSVDVERSFSMYRNILTDKRCRLIESSIEALSLINYNVNFNIENNEE